MKLKVGDKIIENDGICIIVYEIIKIEKRKAIGKTEFEGTAYFTAYKTKQEDPGNIQTFNVIPGDLTIKKLIR